MSADNWGDCPKCKVDIELKNAQEIAEVNKLYGKVSADEYMARLKQAGKNKYEDGTLREDYEIGVTSCGEFYVSYGAYCSRCGFQYDYDYKENVAT